MLHNSLYEANLLHPNSNIPNPKMSRAHIQARVDISVPVGDTTWEGSFPLVLGVMESERQKNGPAARKQANKQTHKKTEGLLQFRSDAIGPCWVMKLEALLHSLTSLLWLSGELCSFPAIYLQIKK